MIQESDLPGLIAQVLAAAFALAIVFGAIAQRTHFCTMGAVADIVNMGDWSRMRMWALAAGVAMLGFNAMVGLGWVEAGKSIYAGSRLIWLSNLVGGLLFGVGMVLASGCGSKTLVRIGGGSLKALVVFCVLGLAAYATMRGVLAVARVQSVDTVALQLPAGQDLPSLLSLWTGLPRPTLAPTRHPPAPRSLPVLRRRGELDDPPGLRSPPGSATGALARGQQPPPWPPAAQPEGLRCHRGVA